VLERVCVRGGDILVDRKIAIGVEAEARVAAVLSSITWA
jgi:hypothetical protein